MDSGWEPTVEKDDEKKTQNAASIFFCKYSARGHAVDARGYRAEETSSCLKQQDQLSPRLTLLSTRVSGDLPMSWLKQPSSVVIVFILFTAVCRKRL